MRSEKHYLHAEISIVLEEFGALIAHKVKNPLAGVVLSAHRLMKKLGAMEDREDLVSLAGQLSEYANRLSESIDDLVEKIPEIPLDRSDVDVTDVLESVWSEISSETGPRNVNVVWNLTKPLPPVRADRAIITAVLSHLVEDALNAEPPPETLTFALHPSGRDFVEIRIMGPDRLLDKDTLRKYIKPFESPESDWTGLRMMISRRAIEAQSGMFEVDCDRASGFSITIRLPVSKNG
jgi:nitrogen-specific signal transduction histidine kinase